MKLSLDMDTVNREDPNFFKNLKLSLKSLWINTLDYDSACFWNIDKLSIEQMKN